MSPTHTTRRTALKTMAATVAGSTLLVGAARGDNERQRDTGPESTVTIVASHDHHGDEHAFTLSRETVPAGWTTLRFANRTEHTHFVYAVRLPPKALAEARTLGMTPLAYYVMRVTRPFQFYMDAFVLGRGGNPDDLFPGTAANFSNLFPAWFGDVVPAGGVGLTSPRERATTVLDLFPGTYVMECYVKDDDNVFHSYDGMLSQLTVSDEAGGATEPSASLDVSVSSDGITADGEVRPGRHTIGVAFDDQRLYDNLVGHDIHIVRLGEGTTAADLNAWMDWRSPTGLVADGSEPGTFVGGVETMAAGGTGYADVTLRPGDYALVAEIPDPAASGHLVEFTVVGP